MGLWKWMMAFYLSHQTMLHDRCFPLVFLRGMKYSILQYSIPSVGSLTGLFPKKWIPMTDQYHWSALIYDMVIAQLLFRKTLHCFFKKKKILGDTVWRSAWPHFTASPLYNWHYHLYTEHKNPPVATAGVHTQGTQPQVCDLPGFNLWELILYIPQITFDHPGQSHLKGFKMLLTSFFGNLISKDIQRLLLNKAYFSRSILPWWLSHQFM